MRKQIVGCRCRSSMCWLVRRTPQGVRRARTSLRTRMGFLDGSPISRRKRKTCVGAPHVSPESCRVAQSEHLLGLRHDIRRLEVRAPIFGNPDVGSALLASQVKLFVARRRESCFIGRSTRYNRGSMLGNPTRRCLRRDMRRQTQVWIGQRSSRLSRKLPRPRGVS